MSKKNNTSITVSGSMKDATIKTGDIHTPKDSLSEENNTSMNMQNIDVSNGNLKTGKIDERLENYQLEVEIQELRKKIQPLLEHLAQNPITANEALAETAIQQQINDNPTLRKRLISALEAGGIQALKAIFNNPAISIPVETIRGFLKAR
ncbi:MAG: hypothetical protein F6K54_11700 [Okeania sp. SIO3B5]|uniref:hypothetical protein n=1 Tax=Okeania sp. SIO3B5 TaxID=2607811 RepID=UPI001401783F|nr:hypothetical protein [Okeania sp. SIO3B5]NEO53683.1 hypothetical protein [Okeania sp. SIO3B5]